MRTNRLQRGEQPLHGGGVGVIDQQTDDAPMRMVDTVRRVVVTARAGRCRGRRGRPTPPVRSGRGPPSAGCRPADGHVAFDLEIQGPGWSVTGTVDAGTCRAFYDNNSL